MATRRPKKPDGGSGDDWMVTFSDCMTLLLCFFVMLLSFSSFDPKTLNRVLGALRSPCNPTVFDAFRLPKDAPVPQDEHTTERTEAGAEKPDPDFFDPNTRPRESLDPLSTEAYRDRRVLNIPSDVLFWGQGTQLKPEAADLLSKIAQYLRLVPCRVVLSETTPVAKHPDLGLARAWVVLNHFTEAEHLPVERFGLSSSAAGLSATAALEPTLRIGMLNHRVYP